MMEDIDIGVTVELLPGFDEVYRAATAGSRGSIKGIKEDDMGFLLVNIEWDKGHWTYAGQNDGWTFANHFAVVVENELICGSDEDPQAKDQYTEAIMDAFDEASESQGFLLVALKEVPTDFPESEIKMYNPVVLVAAMTEDAARVLEELRNFAEDIDEDDEDFEDDE